MVYLVRFVWTTLALILILDCEVQSEDCRPVGDCIHGNGGTTFSVSFYPDFSNFDILSYTQFLGALCSHLQYYYLCQAQNMTALTSSCEYLIGEFEGGIISTQNQRQQLAETQCADKQGMAYAVECLLSNSVIEIAVESCTNKIPQRQGSLCNAVEVWNTCINGTVGTCDGQAINYWKTLTQKYIDLFCTNSLAPETKQLSSIVVTVSLLCNIYFIYFTGFS